MGRPILKTGEYWAWDDEYSSYEDGELFVGYHSRAHVAEDYAEKCDIEGGDGVMEKRVVRVEDWDGEVAVYEVYAEMICKAAYTSKRVM